MTFTSSLRCASLLIGSALAITSPALFGQSSLVNANTVLPEAPSPVLNQPGMSTSAQDITGSGTISGAVTDPTGAAIENARVQLVNAEGKTVRETRTVTLGEFTLNAVPQGEFSLQVTAVGFASFTSGSITITDNQAYVAPTITLPIGASTSEVEVRANDPKIADAQVKAAEKQRVLGFVPNFYTSYVYDAVPLTSKQKYTFAIRETLDPSRFIGSAIGAGIEQANDSFKGYGYGAAGYGKRYAALYGDGLFSDILSHAVFPALLKQDPRYFYQGSGSVKSRFIHAVSFAVLIRSDSGRTVPNYSYLFADLGSGSLSNLYYPHAERGAGLVFTNTAIGIAGRAAGALVNEFILPRLTTHKAGAGKP